MLTRLSTQSRRDLAWLTALILLLTTVWIARGDTAQAGFGVPPGDGIDVAYVAVGTGFPDSLGVGPGAGIDNAPIIIVPTNPPIPTVTEDELIRLDPKTVIIVGGTVVVSQAMQDDLEALLPNAVFSRIAGANRYETNAMFSAANYPVEGWVSIPSVAFTTPNPSDDIASFQTNSAQNLGSGVLYAPIQLPHRAEIMEFVFTGNDEDPGTDLQAELLAVSHATATVSVITTVATNGTPGQFAVSTATVAMGQERVDNAGNSYMVRVTNQTGTSLITNAAVRYRLGAP